MPFGLFFHGTVGGFRAPSWPGFLSAACVVTLMVITPSLSTAMGAKPKAPDRPQTVAVRFQEGVSEARIREIWAAEKLENAVFLPNVGVYVVTLPVGAEAQRLRQRLSAYPEVRYAEVNARTEPLEVK